MPMDITGTEGPNKGKTILAIYERDGDTLRVCYDLSGKSRPSEFKTTEGTRLFLVEYKLQKEAEKIAQTHQKRREQLELMSSSGSNEKR